MIATEPTSGFRREIRVEIGECLVAGELIDDFHHFRAEFDVLPGRIVAARGFAIRQPWATCPGAVSRVTDFIGPASAGSFRAVLASVDRRTHCTHLCDAAALAIARWARGAGSAVFSLFVADPVQGPTTAKIDRDGVSLHEWQVERLRILGPAAWKGRVLGPGGGFLASLAAESGEDQIEAALLLQRACTIALGRGFDLDLYRHADDVPGAPRGVCHTYAASTSADATRKLGATLDFGPAADLRQESRDWAAADERT